MATVPSTPVYKNGYPTSDGKPMAETDWHRKLMNTLIVALDEHFAASPRVYVSGNLLLFYEPGNRRRHVSPDVFVVRGVGKYDRPNYLVWEEKSPQIVLELTSSTTRRDDLTTKYALYQDTLKVREYFLFDPLGDYLDPPLQGHRLRQGVYRPIRPVGGRSPSQVLGLHLERSGRELRLFDPLAGRWLLTSPEMVQEAAARRRQAEAREQQAEEARRQAEADRQRETEARRAAEAEVERLRQLLEGLRGRQEEI